MEDNNKIMHYIQYFVLFIMGQSCSMWGQYVTLPYKNLSMLEAYKMAIPFAWLDWFFMTFAIDIGNKYNLVTPTQDTFLLIIIQFTLILIINQFYLKQEIYKSDIVAFFIILTGFFVSYYKIVSNFFHLSLKEIDKDVSTEKDESENK